MNQQDENLEKQLNPPPKKYMVNIAIKRIFAVVFIVVVFLYFYFVAQRRYQIKKYINNYFELNDQSYDEYLPNITAVDIDDNSLVNISSLNSELILLNFWATWCPACLSEKPSLELFSQKLAGKIKVISLSIDDDLTDVKKYLVNNKYSFLTLWDKEKISQKLLTEKIYPQSWLIDAEGKIIKKFMGAQNWEDFKL